MYKSRDYYRSDDTYSTLEISYKPREPNLTVSVELKCYHVLDWILNYTSVYNEETNFRITANSITACKVDQVNGFFIWVDVNKWFIFPVFLILGAVLCFAGKYYLRYLIFLAGVIEGSFLIILIFYSTVASTNGRDKEFAGWAILICSVLIGLGVGFILMKYEKFGGFCLVAWGGFSTGLLIYNAFLYKIDS